MPWGFMPNGTVVNHTSAGSFVGQLTVEPMNASTVPWDAASKQPSGAMSWPAGKTSIWNRPALISSTTLASRSAEPCSTSSAGVQSVGIRHLNFGWAMTFGASATVAVATARTPPAFARNLRRSMCSSSRQNRLDLFHELRKVDRFGVVVVTAGFEGLFAVAGHRMSGQRDDGNGPGRERRLDAARGLPAVDSRQPQVHEDQVGHLGLGHRHA